MDAILDTNHEKIKLEDDLAFMKNILEKEQMKLANIEEFIEAIYLKIDSIEDKLVEINN